MAGANVNIAIQQNGDNLEIGSRAGQRVVINWRELLAALAVGGGGDLVGFSNDFVDGNAVTAITENVADGASVAAVAGAGGQIVLATGATNNNHVTAALSLSWSPAGLTFTCRAGNSAAILTRIAEIGLSDALSETNGIAFSSHDATPVAVATNALIFGYNTGESLANWSILTVNDGTAARVDSGIPVAAGFNEFRIVITPTLTAHFYIDGALVASVEEAVDEAALLTPWISLKTLSVANKELKVDSLTVIGER